MSIRNFVRPGVPRPLPECRSSSASRTTSTSSPSRCSSSRLLPAVLADDHLDRDQRLLPRRSGRGPGAHPQPPAARKDVYRALSSCRGRSRSLVAAGVAHRAQCQYGMVNQLLGLFGVAPVQWLSEPFWNFAAMIIVNVWLGVPFMMVITLGGLQSISGDLYEAAEIDGANSRQSFRQHHPAAAAAGPGAGHPPGHGPDVQQLPGAVLHQPERAGDERHPGHRALPRGLPVQPLRFAARTRSSSSRSCCVFTIFYVRRTSTEGGLRMSIQVRRCWTSGASARSRHPAAPRQPRQDSPLKRLLIHVVLILSRAVRAVPGHPRVRHSAAARQQPAQPEPGLIPRGATLDPSTTSCSRPACPLDGQQPGHHGRHGARRPHPGRDVRLRLLALQVPGPRLGLTFLFATQLIPGIMLLVPIFLLAVNLDLTGTYQGLVIAYAVTAVPFSIWILRATTTPCPWSSRRRPSSTAARSSRRSAILLPLSLPALAIVFLFNFLAAWGEYFTAAVHRRERGAAHMAAGHPAVPAAVPDAVGGPRGRLDHRVGAHRHPVRVRLQVPRLGPHPRRRQGVSMADRDPRLGPRRGLLPDLPRPVRGAARVPKPGPLEPGTPADRPRLQGRRPARGRRAPRPPRRPRASTRIYFNPIFQSASNHRYHTYDYFTVDPLLGGDAALRELLDACHARGMRVVLDGVFNHASRGFWPFHHVLENGTASPYRDWFYFNDEDLEAGRPLRAYPSDAAGHRPPTSGRRSDRRRGVARCDARLPGVVGPAGAAEAQHRQPATCASTSSASRSTGSASASTAGGSTSPRRSPTSSGGSSGSGSRRSTRRPTSSPRSGTRSRVTSRATCTTRS